jgi:uncharacterized protein YciI
MNGSMMVVNLENEDAARAWAKNDPYIIGNVWETIEIIPFRMADV